MQDIDFLPERIRLQRLRRRRLTRQGYLLTLVIVGVVIWGYSWRGRVSRAQAELDLLHDRSVSVQRLLSNRDRLEQEQGELLIKERINTTLGSRISTQDLLAELERLLPRGVSLISLDLEAVQMRMPEASDSGAARGASVTERPRDQMVNRVRLVLTGIAPNDVDVANFIGQLSASPLLEDVNMGYAKTLVYRGHRAREFQASCNVVR